MISHEHGVLEGSNYYIYTPSIQATRAYFYPLYVGHFYYAVDYQLQRNSFDSYLIMYIKKGQCIVCQDSRTFTAKTNQIVLLDCYIPHSYTTDTGWEAEWLHFDGPLAREYYNLIVNTVGYNITLQDPTRFQEALHRIYDMFIENSVTKEVLLNKYITDLLTELILSKDKEINQVRKEDMIEAATTYINEHLTEEISLDSLADMVSLSPYYFIRLFKKQIGLTPHDYIITARINHAKFLLKTTDISIKEICFSTGFLSESSFCSTFKKREKLTPSEFRNQ